MGQSLSNTHKHKNTDTTHTFALPTAQLCLSSEVVLRENKTHNDAQLLDAQLGHRSFGLPGHELEGKKQLGRSV